MHCASSPFRFLAAALAVVLVAGVALPVAVYACATTGEAHLAACCEEREAQPPCHPAPTGMPLEDLPGTGHLATCCTASGVTSVGEAALMEPPRAPLMAVCGVCASPWTPPFPASDRAAGAMPSLPDTPGLGLHLRYGVLLN